LKAHLKKIEQEEAKRKERQVSGNSTGDDNNYDSESVTPHDIAEVISRWTGIPVSRLSQTE